MPISNRVIIIGASQNFFRSFMKNHRSDKNSIFQYFWFVIIYFLLYLINSDIGSLFNYELAITNPIDETAQCPAFSDYLGRNL